MNWREDFLLEAEGEATRQRGQYQLVAYAIHLSLGNTIYCRSIKGSTIEQYIMAVALFLMYFSGQDYRKDRPGDTKHGSILGPVLKELKRFDELPDKKEPYTPLMHATARQCAAGVNPLHGIPALVDGCEIGYCAGHRLSEWAQPGDRRDVMRPLEGDPRINSRRTRALTPNDIRVLTADNRSLVGLAILSVAVTAIRKMWLCWRYQKNQDNGQEKLFTLNPQPDGTCCVRSACRSLSRFQKLQERDPRLDPDTTPLSVYWAPSRGRVELINANVIERFIRQLAASVCHLDLQRDQESLQRWSSRSLRIGACVTLHSMGFAPIDIQWTLRWKSTAFMEYLRNVPVLADRQNLAYNRASGMPNF